MLHSPIKDHFFRPYRSAGWKQTAQSDRYNIHRKIIVVKALSRIASWHSILMGKQKKIMGV